MTSKIGKDLAGNLKVAVGYGFLWTERGLRKVAELKMGL